MVIHLQVQGSTEEAKNDINIMKSLILRLSHTLACGKLYDWYTAHQIADGEKLSDKGALHAYS